MARTSESSIFLEGPHDTGRGSRRSFHDSAESLFQTSFKRTSLATGKLFQMKISFRPKFRYLGVVLAFTIALSSTSYALSEKVQQTLSEAEQMMKGGRYSSVRTLLTGTLSESTSDEDKAALLQALAKVTERDVPTGKKRTVEAVTRARLAAVELYDKSLVLSGITVEQKLKGLRDAASLLHLEGKREQATDYRKRMLQVEALPARERVSLLQLLARQASDKKEAADYLQQGLNASGASDIERAGLYLQLGKTLREDGQFEKSRKALEAISAIESLPDSWDVQVELELTELELASNNKREAAERLRALTKNGLGNGIPRYALLALARKFRDAGDGETYVGLMDLLIKDEEKPGNQIETATLELADYYAGLGQMEKAHKALEAAPHSRRAIYQDLQLYHKQNQPEKLARRYSQVVSTLKQERARQASNELNSLWQQLPGLAGPYIKQYSQSKTKKVAVNLLETLCEFYGSDTMQYKAIQDEIKRVSGL